MAEDEESRTELSAKRVEEAWREGNVPLGRDAPLVGSLAAGTAALLLLGGSLRTSLVHALREAMGSVAGTPFRDLPHLAALPAAAAAAICLSAAAGSALVTMVQTKGTFWPERWVPDVSRLFNPSRLTQLLSKNTLIDLFLAAVKVVALGWTAWSSVHGDFMTLPSLLGAAPADQLARTFAILLRAGWRTLLVAALIAGADLAVVHWRFKKQMRVTKQDAKRESKEQEGDPLIKGKRKQKHRELSRGRARVEVPRADALLVNPTHIAIALRYRRDEGRAPRVIAKGKGALAEYMRDLARENAIPIVQDIPLARLLYRKVKLGREVPASTYKAVAAVLAFVYRITGRASGGKGAIA
jgi:flagellar biosynthesis protein FlhB